jgi:hypothetical protein
LGGLTAYGGAVKRLFMSSVLALALTPVWCATSAFAATRHGQPSSQPRWLVVVETKFLDRVLGGARPVRTYLISYPRKIAVVFEFGRVVICGACSAPSNASLPRGRLIRVSFDRKTHAALSGDGLRFCEARGMYPPKSVCLQR